MLRDIIYNFCRELMYKNPIEKYEIILKDGTEEEKFAKRILIFLYSVNKVIENQYGYKYFFYIMDDNSIFELLRRQYQYLRKDVFDKAICMLDYTKLIYRFTCAKKFEIKDSKIQQLRINSWGREKIESETNLFSESGEYTQIYKLVDDHIRTNEKIYIELLSILNCPITEEATLKIRKLNQKVILKLLA